MSGLTIHGIQTIPRWKQFLSNVVSRQINSGFSKKLQHSLFSIICLGLVSSSCGMATTTAQSTHIKTTHPSSYQVKTLIKKSPNYLTQAVAQNIDDIFKTPDLIREESPAVVWHYEGQNCVMDIYYMVEDGQTAAQVQYFEIRDKQGVLLDETAQKSCLKTIIN